MTLDQWISVCSAIAASFALIAAALMAKGAEAAVTELQERRAEVLAAMAEARTSRAAADAARSRADMLSIALVVKLQALDARPREGMTVEPVEDLRPGTPGAES